MTVEKSSAPTLRDVAALAGVSHQTVSRVINASERVLPETKARVEAAIEKLGYRPNAIARSMVRGQTSTFGCLAPNLTDYTYASLIEGAETEVRRNGYFLLSSSANSEADFVALIDELVGYRRVDGMFVISPFIDERFDHLPANIPVVFVGARSRSKLLHTVYLDNQEGSCRAARHLVDLGHTVIAQVTGPHLEDCVEDRSHGYEQALLEAGITPDPDLTVEGNWTATSGYEAFQQIRARGLNPTAYVVQNDRMAVGVLRAARDAGLRVPEDLSVVGFDDMPLASYFDPPLTTIRQDTFAMGRAAAQRLVELLTQTEISHQHIRFPAELVVRKSTGPCLH